MSVVSESTSMMTHEDSNDGGLVIVDDSSQNLFPPGLLYSYIHLIWPLAVYTFFHDTHLWTISSCIPLKLLKYFLSFFVWTKEHGGWVVKHLTSKSQVRI